MKMSPNWVLALFVGFCSAGLSAAQQHTCYLCGHEAAQDGDPHQLRGCRGDTFQATGLPTEPCEEPSKCFVSYTVVGDNVAWGRGCSHGDCNEYTTGSNWLKCCVGDLCNDFGSSDGSSGAGHVTGSHALLPVVVIAAVVMATRQ